MSETVFRIENNVTLKELDFKLGKIRDALSSHYNKVKRDLKYAGERDSKVLKVDCEICEKAIDYVGKILGNHPYILGLFENYIILSIFLSF